MDGKRSFIWVHQPRQLPAASTRFPAAVASDAVASGAAAASRPLSSSICWRSDCARLLRMCFCAASTSSRWRASSFLRARSLGLQKSQPMQRGQ